MGDRAPSELRPTLARERVLEALRKAGRPLSHAELAARRSLAALGRVTLYRTLGTLADAGLLDRVIDDAGTWRFCAHERRPQGCPGGHPHLFCNACETMLCLPEQDLPWVRVPAGFQVQGKQLLVHGLCERCAEKAQH